jgi:hypothetical protein
MPDLLERIDQILAQLTGLRAELVASMPAPATEGNGLHADDDWLEISTAVERFNRPPDTLRYWCRHEGCGKKTGGRWLISARRETRIATRKMKAKREMLVGRLETLACGTPKICSLITNVNYVPF